MHVPKTAGTALTRLLRVNEPYASRSGNVFKGSGGASADHDYDRAVTRALADPRVGLVSGHTTMAFAARVPADREPRCMTMLRDPVDRALSHYFMAVANSQRREPGPRRVEKAAMGEGRGRLTPEVDFDTAFAGVAFVPDNLHTRMLCGDPHPFGPVTPEMLEAAKRNLSERIHVFGITQRFDESIALIARRLGHRNMLHQTRRENAERPRGADVPAALTAAARRHNAADIELYRYACELFDRSPELEDPDFRLDVAALRQAGDAPPDDSGDEAWRRLVQERARRLQTEHELALERLTVADLQDAATGATGVRGRPMRAARLR